MTTVIVVDDDANMRDTIVDILTMEGYPVEAFASARDVTARVGVGDVGLVVTDLNMPDLDGMGLIDQIRAAGHRVPVVMLTGAGFEHRAEDALARGATACFAKPFDIDAFLRVVEKVLGPPPGGGAG